MIDWFEEAKQPGGRFDLTPVSIRATPSLLCDDWYIATYFSPFHGLRSHTDPMATAMRYEQPLNPDRRKSVHQMTGPAFVMKDFVQRMPHDIRQRCFVPDGAEPFCDIRPLARKWDWRTLFKGWRWAS